MKLFMFSYVFVCGSASVLGLGHEAPQIKRGDMKIVNTTSGMVSGHTASNSSANVSEFLGIPYAQPPVGDLRFAPPVRYDSTSSINGTQFGFSCPQNQFVGGLTNNPSIRFANLTVAGLEILSILSQTGDRFSEDCLTLNVWVPSGGEPKKAVMVWIYGGGFTTGATSLPMYDGQNLASQGDVIVVSMNYRLNIFGFPGNPSIPNLNLGLLDQRMAIEWVRDNVAAFGGDPSKITIFGQSAGSASVDYYSYAYTSDPIVAGFIQQSGTLNGFGVTSTTTANMGWFNVTTTLGCGSSSSNLSKVLACMRTKSTDSILKAMPQGPLGFGSPTIFGPAVDNITVFSDYPARSALGNFIKAPLLSGNTDYEAGIFEAIAALSNVTYPPEIWEAFNLQAFTCASGLRANVSISAGAPTWRYRYFGVFPNLRLTSAPESGAWHGGEIPLIFGNFPPARNSIPMNTDAEISIGSYIRGAWAAFAKDPANGLKDYQEGWPIYDPSASTLIRLAYNNITGTNLGMPAMYDTGCGNSFPL